MEQWYSVGIVHSFRRLACPSTQDGTVFRQRSHIVSAPDRLRLLNRGFRPEPSGAVERNMLH
ncbi:hypothetical protein D3869_23500 (plasmid) [Azospirillum brasilense]|uniref:Uncharacterized protein n=1 Tax=Azospirillum brasilense TaxID=192 RepID=A0A4D8RC81_AZOBR|nr:hypothetical protein D3869_23500 [Azospirillum brasilense]